MKKNENDCKKKENNSLILIPKIEKYIEYVLNILLKLPRTEKFSIGTEYKNSMYKMLEEIMLLNKINTKQIENKINLISVNNRQKYLEGLNKIDALLNCQRIYLRIMKNNYWIDEKKFIVAMEKIYEIGKIIGGLQKYYAKEDKK